MGFTLVELIVVLVLLGIVSVYIAPRFSGSGVYDALVARQDVKQSLRYAQQLAMARTTQSVTWSVNAANASISILSGGNLVDRADGVENPLVLPRITFAANTLITFDYHGSLTDGVDKTIQVSDEGEGAGRVCVSGVTGYAYDC